jgi:hypothetical protein
MVAGRARWVERMRDLKAAGVIARFPNGGRSRTLPPLSRDPTIRKAQRMIEKMKAQRDVSVPAKAWAEMSKGEKLSAAADLGLDIAYEIMQRPLDWEDLKQVQIVRDTALSVISNQIRVDAAVINAAAKRDVRELTDEELLAILADRRLTDG